MLNSVLLNYYFENFLIVSQFIIIILFLMCFLILISTLLLKKNILAFFISCEYIIVTLSALFAIIGIYNLDISGLLYSLILLVIAACDSVIGLTLILIYYKVNKTISLTSLKKLK